MGDIFTPDNVTYRDIRRKSHSWSATQYKGVKFRNSNIKKVADLLLSRKIISGKEVGSVAYVPFATPFKFLRTKAIRENNFGINWEISGSFEYIYPNSFEANKGASDQRVVNKGDLLFVTGGNVGEVALATETSQTIISSHILKVPILTHKNYVFVFLKSPLGKAQSNLGPIGAIAGLDTFSEETLLKVDVPFPQENYEPIMSFVDTLVQMVLDKEEILRQKSTAIDALIRGELDSEQQGKDFNFLPPTFSDLRSVKRLDTGMYSEEYMSVSHKILNYKYGYSSLVELGYSITRGQNLQVSSIGRSVYSNTEKPHYYRLLLSKDISDWMTGSESLFLGTKKILKEVKQNDIIFSCRGDLGRIFICMNKGERLITNIDNVHITNEHASISHKIFVAAFLNYLRKVKFLEKISITGSGADSFTKYQFALIKIPSFPEKKQREIASVFTNAKPYPKFKDKLLFEEDQKWNRSVGIVELDNSLRKVRQKINDTLLAIANNQTVDLQTEF